MRFTAKSCRCTVFLFLLLLCIPPARAQDNAPAPKVPANDNVRRIQALRRALMEGPQSEVPAGELMRLLALPAAQQALGLSDEQRKKIDDIAFNLERTMVQQEALHRIQQLELERLLRADAPDRPAIDKKIQEIGQAQSAILKTRIGGLLDVRSVLTKDQQERLKEFIRQRARQRAPQPPEAPAPKAPPKAPVN